MERNASPTLANIQVDREVGSRIEEYAKAKGSTPAEVVRQAFDEFESTHNGKHGEPADLGGETVFDRLNRAGFIGCLKDAPSDLSTNPKYMEGFGRD